MGKGAAEQYGASCEWPLLCAPLPEWQRDLEISEPPTSAPLKPGLARVKKGIAKPVGQQGDRRARNLFEGHDEGRDGKADSTKLFRGRDCLKAMDNAAKIVGNPKFGFRRTAAQSATNEVQASSRRQYTRQYAGGRGRCHDR